MEKFNLPNDCYYEIYLHSELQLMINMIMLSKKNVLYAKTNDSIWKNYVDYKWFNYFEMDESNNYYNVIKKYYNIKKLMKKTGNNNIYPISYCFKISCYDYFGMRNHKLCKEFGELTNLKSLMLNLIETKKKYLMN